jgi:hypothetical protein
LLVFHHKSPADGLAGAVVLNLSGFATLMVPVLEILILEPIFTPPNCVAVAGAII